ncbi:MAG: VanZ family protein [Clostridia bacterium]|nr:VanZ family protein [Clostridia bacterium]
MFLLKKNKPLAVVFWLLTAAVMYVIFMFSAATGSESQQVSQNLLGIIVEFIGQFISHNTLRKFAHFTEFAALGFCVTGAVHFTFEKRDFRLSFFPCLLYAVSDEIHQYFVPERACRVFDMFIDSCGIATGIGIFMLIVFIIKKISNKNRLAD